jgi:hypothetical protein
LADVGKEINFKKHPTCQGWHDLTATRYRCKTPTEDETGDRDAEHALLAVAIPRGTALGLYSSIPESPRFEAAFEGLQ